MKGLCKNIELYARCAQLPFTLGFAVVGYQAILNFSKGFPHWVLLIMFYLFIVVTMTIEFIEIRKLKEAKQQKQ